MMILHWLVTVSIIYVMLIIVSQKKIEIIFKPTSKSNLGTKFKYSLQRKNCRWNIINWSTFCDIAIEFHSHAYLVFPRFWLEANVARLDWCLQGVIYDCALVCVSFI